MPILATKGVTEKLSDANVDIAFYQLPKGYQEVGGLDCSTRSGITSLWRITPVTFPVYVPL